MKLPSDLKQRLLSRKLWLTIGGAITLAANQQWTEMVALIVGYLAAEGASDVVTASKMSSPNSPENYHNLDDLRTSDTPIVSGGRYASLTAEDNLDADDDEDN